ncbi:MAG: hypothetical protein IH788_04035 [Nitrospinae bacterium]|nr:hypothetical protein [Nitrospinota bacterium]
MRRIWLVGLAAALAIIILPTPGAAQVPSDKGKNVRTFNKIKQERMERIRSVFLKRLGEELKLDKATLDKMSESFDRFLDQASTFRKKDETMVTKLKAALEREASENELKAILGEFEGFHVRRHQLMRERLAEERNILGTRRYAQYVVFRQKFRHGLRGMMHGRGLKSRPGSLRK